MDLVVNRRGEGDAVTTGPAPINVYLYAGDQIIENVTKGYFYYQDSLGNTSHVTDAAGNLLERYTYSAFGEPYFFSPTGTTSMAASAINVKHLFQGQLWTQETGLNDYRNRVELPVMGVFLQPDPIGFKGDAANIYRFCTNNAVNRTDPTGLVDLQSGSTVAERMRLFYGDNLVQESLYDLDHPNVGLTMATVQAAARERQLMPMPPELTRRMYADQQQNATQAADKNNWTHLEGTRMQQEEYATGVYRKGNGLVSDGPNRGSHMNGTPTSEIFRKEYKGGGTRAAGTHIHVTGNGRHLLFDRDQAVRYRVISGTGHVSHPEKMEIFRPYKSGEGGQYYHMNDEEHVIPGRLPW